VPFPKHLGFPQNVPEACLAPEKSRPQGLATLSTRLPAPYPVEASFSPQRSWASPFRALLLSRDRRKVSLPLSAPALPCETSRPRIDASAASSPLKSRTPFCSPGGLVRVGASCLLGLPTSRALPHPTPLKRLLHASESPLVLPPKTPCNASGREPQGLSAGCLALSPRKGRRPVWPSSPDSNLPPL
jgi:hypothetical protein